MSRGRERRERCDARGTNLEFRYREVRRERGEERRGEGMEGEKRGIF